MAEKRQKKRKPSILKRQRQTIKRNARNVPLRSSFKTHLKKFFTAVPQDLADQGLSKIHSLIDKARTKGIISKNAASRKKAQTAAFLIKNKTAALTNEKSA